MSPDSPPPLLLLERYGSTVDTVTPAGNPVTLPNRYLHDPDLSQSLHSSVVDGLYMVRTSSPSVRFGGRDIAWRELTPREREQYTKLKHEHRK
jgi:hypothetical protein